MLPLTPLQLAHGVGAEPCLLRKLLLGEASGLALALEAHAESLVLGVGHIVVVLLLARMVARPLTRTEWVIEWAVLVVTAPLGPQTETSKKAMERRAICLERERGAWRSRGKGGC